jgi:hypothetical protein
MFERTEALRGARVVDDVASHGLNHSGALRTWFGEGEGVNSSDELQLLRFCVAGEELTIPTFLPYGRLLRGG